MRSPRSCSSWSITHPQQLVPSTWTNATSSRPCLSPISCSDSTIKNFTSLSSKRTMQEGLVSHRSEIHLTFTGANFYFSWGLSMRPCWRIHKWSISSTSLISSNRSITSSNAFLKCFTLVCRWMSSHQGNRLTSLATAVSSQWLYSKRLSWFAQYCSNCLSMPMSGQSLTQAPILS